jgi:3-hydroxybutyryl-CoA dehydrogenase
MESIYQQYYDEPRFRPVPLTRRRVDAGLFGRKNGRGFYAYPEGKMEMPAEPKLPAARPGKVWVSSADPEAQETLLGLLHKLGATIAQDRLPPQDALILVTPFGSDATTAAVTGGFDPLRTVAVDCLTDLAKRRTIMTTPATDPAFRDAAHGLLGSDGVPVTVIADSAGFVAQRILAAIVNVGCDIAQQKIARPKDIDRAVTLGLGYPKGPLAFGDHYGTKRILQILEHMQSFYGDPRYRPSPWLKRRAALGLSLLTEGN